MRLKRRREGLDESGFTLIELIVTVAILPMVVGAIAVALLSVFSLQGSVSNRIGDSNDELVSASTSTGTCKAPRRSRHRPRQHAESGGQTQLVGLEWGLDANGNYQSVVSYVTVPSGTKTSLLRQACTAPPAPHRARRRAHARSLTTRAPRR